jgi:hypothetical protein
MPQGNIFHNALSWFFSENKLEEGTWGVETPYKRIYICGSGAKRGGGCKRHSRTQCRYENISYGRQNIIFYLFNG